MATNTFKNIETGNSFRLFGLVEKVVGKEWLVNSGISVNIVPIAAFLIGVGLFYIGITHYAERMIRDYDQLKQEVDDLRTDFTTLKADYMYSSKQSEVAKRVNRLELVESNKPPYKLKLKKD